MSEKWYEITPSMVEGRGWENTENPFGRLPFKLKRSANWAYMNSHSPMGESVFFNTNSPFLKVRCVLKNRQLGEANFNIVAYSGTDLYIFDDRQNRWRWAAATPHFAIKNRFPEYFLLEDLPAASRRCRLYLPSRNPLLKLEIGVADDAQFQIVPPRTDKPLVYYGTSIIHGAFNIRCGLGTAQILGRNLDMPVINLGFSGSAQLEKEMAQALAELDSAMYIIDPFHNMNPEKIAARLEIFLETLCSAKPGIPVLVVSAPADLKSWLYPALEKSEKRKSVLMASITHKLQKKFPCLHYMNGSKFYGSDEVSMDGVHPNDMAMAHMADVLERKIRSIMNINK